MTIEAPSVSAPTVSEPSLPSNSADGLSVYENGIDPEWQALKGEAFSDDSFKDHLKDTAAEFDKTQPGNKPAEVDKNQTIKLKVNGKEIEQPLSEVVKMAQLYQASEIKLENLKQQKAQVDGQIQQVQALGKIMKSGNPEHISEVFKMLGVDFNKVAAQHVKKMFDLDMMPAEQKKAYQLEQQVKQLQAQQHQQNQMEQARIQQYHDQKAAEELQIEIPKALKEVNLQTSPEIIARIAQVWQSALRAGKNPTATQVASYVKGMIENERRALVQGLDTEGLKNVLGDKANELAKALQPKKTFVQSDKFSKTPKAEPQSTYIKQSDWRKR